MINFPTWVMSGKRSWLTLLACFIISLSFFSSNTGVMGYRSNETDLLALLAFKAKIINDPFKMMMLWNKSIHFCEWYGVTCSTRHQRVTGLNLASLKLGGSISPHVGNLSFLSVLYLQNNSFISQIPAEIGRLRRLKVLNLKNNTLAGEIPFNLSGCSQLMSLVVSNNELEGEIPSDLGSLSNLQYLEASKNNLSGVLPPSLGNLTLLEGLLVAYTNLVGEIPETLGRLRYLTVLYLGYNSFYGEVPSAIFNISSMVSIDIGFNQLGGHLPSNLFHTLPNLQVLYVDKNQFTGPIPTSLSNASNINSLQLGLNKFIGKVPSIESLNKLEQFSIGGNQLGSGVGAQDDLNFLCSLTNATSLILLEIDTNNFGGMFPQCVTNLSSQLTLLSVFNNHISGSIPPGIDNLKLLNVVSISNNSFTGSIPPSIGNLENLVILYLDTNLLSGKIPTSLGKLLNLNQLDLSSNHLGGTIPSSLQNCTFLQALSLSHNNLIGSIPQQVITIPSLSISLLVSHNQLSGSLSEEVGKLTNLYMLDVSANKLSGKIPDSLGECTNMQFLGLYANNFQGPIPSSLSSMRGLQVLDVSYNNLSGRIPDFLASFIYLFMLNISFNDLEGVVPQKRVFLNVSATSLRGNNKLCGGIPAFHLPECSSATERKRRKLSVKSKVVIATFAGLLGVTALILILFVLAFKRKQRQNQEEHVITLSENQALQIVSYGDLYKATNGFSEGNLIEKGYFGRVYRGILGENKPDVAIKVLNLNHHGASKSFVAECEALRSIRHRNLVKLLTVCSGIDYQGNEFKALVYEFMPNGSLEDWLHQPAIKKDEPTSSEKLDLFQRLGIAIDVASLLQYVHHEFGTPLVHCDIKPSNILLDDDLFGHVSDFGLAKFLLDGSIIRNSVDPSSSTGVRGTVGYAPPEYGLGSEVSTQGDVYSYGILLLELFTGKRPTHEMFKEGLSLHLYAKMALSSSVVNILDPILYDLLETEDRVLNPVKSAKVTNLLGSVIEIGVACSNESPMERMGMDIVTTKLQKIKERLSGRRN